MSPWNGRYVAKCGLTLLYHHTKIRQNGILIPVNHSSVKDPTDDVTDNEVHPPICVFYLPRTLAESPEISCTVVDTDDVTLSGDMEHLSNVVCADINVEEDKSIGSQNLVRSLKYLINTEAKL